MHPITAHPIRDILALLAENVEFQGSETGLCELLRLIRVAEHFQPRGGRDFPAEPDVALPH